MLQSSHQSQQIPASDILSELREAAHVRGGGNEEGVAEEEIYESVKVAFERLREEIDEIQATVAEIDTVAPRTFGRIHGRRRQRGAGRGE